MPNKRRLAPMPAPRWWPAVMAVSRWCARMATAGLSVALDEPLFAPVQLQLPNDAAGWVARLEAKS